MKLQRFHLNRRRERRLWAGLLGLSLAANVLAFAALSGPGLRAEGDSSRSHVYQQALQYLSYYMQNLYVEPISEEKLMEGAVRGLLASAEDPYTRFLNTGELDEFSNMEAGRRVGVGVEVTMQDGVPVVIAPLGGGPAEKAGILPGDRIVEIDGEETEDRPFSEIVRWITGERGTVVRLGIQRPGLAEPLQIPITRGEFQIDYVRTNYFEEDKIGYLRLYHFFGQEAGTIEKFRVAVADFQARGARGLILDLRSNPGGQLDMAGEFAGYFLKPGQAVVHARGRDPKMNRTLFAEGPNAGMAAELPLVVLVNEGSASASEILAGALQDHKRARLVGAQTFGKASVQRVIRPLPGDTAALITIQKYFTPENRAIHGTGLRPDIPVAGLRPGPADNLTLKTLEDDDYFARLQERFPTFKEEVVEAFQKDLAERGLRLQPELARYVLKEKYRVYNPGKPRPEEDPQLARALQELR